MQEHKYFEDAFKVYERGVKIFKYPHVMGHIPLKVRKEIWKGKTRTGKRAV